VLLKVAPDPNHLLFFINAVDVYLVNMFLNGRPYNIVSCVERYRLLGANTFSGMKSGISTEQYGSFMNA